VNGGEAVLPGHHHLHPAPPIGGHGIGGGVEQLAGQTVAGEQLADLLSLTCGYEIDVPLLLSSDPTLAPLLGVDAEIVGDRHAEPVGDEVRRPEHEHDGGVEAPSGDAGHDGVRRHGAVDRAVDHVAEVTRPGWLGKARRDRSRPVRGREETRRRIGRPAARSALHTPHLRHQSTLDPGSLFAE
jgi:hypothetical protein